MCGRELWLNEHRVIGQITGLPSGGVEGISVAFYSLKLD